MVAAEEEVVEAVVICTSTELDDELRWVIEPRNEEVTPQKFRSVDRT